MLYTRDGVMNINGFGMQVDGPLDITNAYTIAFWIQLDQPLSGRDYIDGTGTPNIRADDQSGSPRHWFEINQGPQPDTRAFLDKFDSTSTGFWVRKQGDSIVFRMDRLRVEQVTPPDSLLFRGGG